MRLIFSMVYQYQNRLWHIRRSAKSVVSESITSLSLLRGSVCKCACLSLHVWVGTCCLHVYHVTYSSSFLYSMYLLYHTVFQRDGFQQAIDLSFIKHSLTISPCEDGFKLSGKGVLWSFCYSSGKRRTRVLLSFALKVFSFQFSLNSKFRAWCNSLQISD